MKLDFQIKTGRISADPLYNILTSWNTQKKWFELRRPSCGSMTFLILTTVHRNVLNLSEEFFKIGAVQPNVTLCP